MHRHHGNWHYSPLFLYQQVNEKSHLKTSMSQWLNSITLSEISRGAREQVLDPCEPLPHHPLQLQICIVMQAETSARTNCCTCRVECEGKMFYSANHLTWNLQLVKYTLVSVQHPFLWGLVLVSCFTYFLYNMRELGTVSCMYTITPEKTTYLHVFWVHTKEPTSISTC